MDLNQLRLRLTLFIDTHWAASMWKSELECSELLHRMFERTRSPLALGHYSLPPTMIFSTVLVMFVAAVLGAPPPTGIVVNIRDFQSNTFDLAFTSPADLAPVQSLNLKPGGTSQGWIISPSGTLFTVANPFVGTSLSFTMAGNGLNPTSAQLCGHPTVKTTWNITANANGLGYNIIEAASKLAVMSWPTSNSSIVQPTTPLTLQTFDPNERRQIFNFNAFVSAASTKSI
ncbi:hypothetical protein B0H19DRAFT_1180419 [Mycena capillaripes]|nr:hypothetical protein B0H19DRAFT_1180419 [Mycena capillaripes]